MLKSHPRSSIISAPEQRRPAEAGEIWPPDHRLAISLPRKRPPPLRADARARRPEPGTRHW